MKLVATRDQGFTIATYRAETRHQSSSAHSSDGKLVALSHEGWEVTSRPDTYTVAGTDDVARMYAVPNIYTKVYVVHADRNTPGFMRSPPEVPYIYALESAMDELAVELGMDPVELRRVNDTMKDPIKGLPFTSRVADAMLRRGRRGVRLEAAQSRAGRRCVDGDWLVGWGCATAVYPDPYCGRGRARPPDPHGEARVQSAAHDIGTGAYTVVGPDRRARTLGVPLGSGAGRAGRQRPAAGAGRRRLQHRPPASARRWSRPASRSATSLRTRPREAG